MANEHREAVDAIEWQHCLRLVVLFFRQNYVDSLHSWRVYTACVSRQFFVKSMLLLGVYGVCIFSGMVIRFEDLQAQCENMLRMAERPEMEGIIEAGKETLFRYLIDEEISAETYQRLLLLLSQK